jgi:hypothetical protein
VKYIQIALRSMLWTIAVYGFVSLLFMLLTGCADAPSRPWCDVLAEQGYACSAPAPAAPAPQPDANYYFDQMRQRSQVINPLDLMPPQQRTTCYTYGNRIECTTR